VRGWKRYAPLALVVIVVGAAIVFLGRDGGDDAEEPKAAAVGTSDVPLTFDEARDQHRTDVDFGAHCDTETGRVALPILDSAPCVERWDGTDNGGATYQGVTSKEIVVAVYQNPRDPLINGLVSGAGANTDPNAAYKAMLDYARIFQRYYQTYGRTVRFVKFEGTGSGTDEVAARADALRIAKEIKAFAAIGGPTQTNAYAQELARDHVICFCPVGPSQAFVRRNAPYVWPAGMAPEQANASAAELFGKQLAGGTARYAGDPALRDQPRVFAYVHYKDPHDPDGGAIVRSFTDALAKRGVEVAVDTEYFLDPTRTQQTARTIIAKLKHARVTTVIYYGDPITPGDLTREATAQNFFPEWVLGPAYLADTTFFARTYDQQQWAHAFGWSGLAARGEREDSADYALYEWAYGTAPPTNASAITLLGPLSLYGGIQLAGPDLTPATLRDGVFRIQPHRGGPMSYSSSWGRHGVWPGVDYNSSDDATLVWYDANATGRDEIGSEGTGMYRYVDGGKRYLPGEFPTEPARWFDPKGAITVYETIPAADRPPTYPSPSPALSPN
jgi:hypothetical protein